MQFGLVIMAALSYVFFLWDQSIDPHGASNTQTLRGLLISPAILMSAYLLNYEGVRGHCEIFVVLVSFFIGLSWILICCLLTNGFNAAGGGAVLISLFIVSFLPARFFIYIFISLTSWIIFDAVQLLYAGVSTEIFIVNNLYMGASLVLSLSAGLQREISVRQQYMAERDLETSRKRVDDLVGAVLSPYEIDKLMKHKAALGRQGIKIAISYRRSDSDAIAGRIRDRLTMLYGLGSVFMDIDSIPYGSDFRTHIRSVFDTTDVALIIVGPEWLGKNGSVTRISDPTDPVRVELEIALSRSRIVIPVLVAGAALPDVSSVPDVLAPFLYLNAIKVDSGKDFPTHFERLVKAIDMLVAGAA
jgi:hypothetical protein